MNVQNSFPNIVAELVLNYINRVNEFTAEPENKYKFYKKEKLNICGWRLSLEDDGTSEHALCLTKDETKALNLENTRQIVGNISEGPSSCVACFNCTSNNTQEEIKNQIVESLNESIKYHVDEISRLQKLLSNSFLK